MNNERYKYYVFGACAIYANNGRSHRHCRQLFIANFGEVRIEQDTYNKGFYVYSPANAETHVQYCYDISYLDGWLYGCVQGANKIVKQKEVIDV